jgi:hypothetical protein
VEMQVLQERLGFGRVASDKTISWEALSGQGRRRDSPVRWVRNRLSVDRARKLVYVHFNVRLLRKVRTVDNNREFCVGG